jgi:hypothetical protein
MSTLGFLKIKSIRNNQVINKKKEITSMNKWHKKAWFVDKNYMISLI